MKNLVYVFTTLVLLSLFADCAGSRATVTLEPTRTPQPSDTSAPTVIPKPTDFSPAGQLASGNIAQVWANDGGDKVTRDELRAASDPSAVHNSVWDGATISLFGARNEVVAFNLVLEAPSADATDVNVSLTSLVGPGGGITTTAASGDGVFNYVGRNIELFYVRYLEIKGISTDLFFSGYYYDERHIPERCRRPYDGETGEGSGVWEDRDCHNKLYPDIAVPLELHSPFTITAGTNQSIWGDIYIPKMAPAGVYTGTIAITEDFFQVIREPKYGYGSGMNPCLDCRILMFSRARPTPIETTVLVRRGTAIGFLIPTVSRNQASSSISWLSSQIDISETYVGSMSMPLRSMSQST